VAVVLQITLIILTECLSKNKQELSCKQSDKTPGGSGEVDLSGWDMKLRDISQAHTLAIP